MGIKTSLIAYRTTLVKCTGQCSQLHMQCVVSNGYSFATSDLTMECGGGGPISYIQHIGLSTRHLRSVISNSIDTVPAGLTALRATLIEQGATLSVPVVLTA